MPQFFLTYSSDSLTNALDLMAPDCFVTAHSFKHSSTSTETRLDLILTVQADTALELGDKLGHINQLIESAKFAFPPNNVGSPLVLWAKLGSEALWTIWTVKHGLTAPLDLGVGDGTIYQLHLQLTILPHSIGTQYQISDLTVTSHQMVFVAHVSGTEPAATRLTLSNPPSNLGILNIGVRGHRNLGPKDYDPFYPCSGLVSVTKDWQRLCTITGHGGPFDNGLFEVFLDLIDGATSIPDITNLKGLLVPGAGLSGGFYEYLQTGVDGLGNESAPSNGFSINLPSAPLIFSDSLSAKTGDLLSMGNQSGPTFGTSGATFSVESNGFVFQDAMVAPLLAPSDPSYGTISPTNLLPPKPGELGFAQSLLRFPLPEPLTKQRTVTFTMTISNVTLGNLGSPVFFPMYSNLGILFSGLGWQLYYTSSETDLAKAWAAHTLHSSTFVGIELGVAHALRLTADWTLGYLALNLYLDNVEVARLVDTVPPSSMDVLLGICVTNELPAYSFARVVNTDEASWSYTKVEVKNISDSLANTFANGSSMTAALSTSSGVDAGQSSQNSSSEGDNVSQSDSSNVNKGTTEQHNGGFTITSGNSLPEQSATNTTVLTLNDFPIVGQNSGDGTFLFHDRQFDIGIDRFVPASLTVEFDNSISDSQGRSPQTNLSFPDSGGSSDQRSGSSSGSNSRANNSSLSTNQETSSGNNQASSKSNGTGATRTDSSNTSHTMTVTGPLTYDIPVSSISRRVFYVGAIVTTTQSKTVGTSSSATQSSSNSSDSSSQVSSGSSHSSQSANNGGDGTTSSGSANSSNSNAASISSDTSNSLNSEDDLSMSTDYFTSDPSKFPFDPSNGLGVQIQELEGVRQQITDKVGNIGLALGWNLPASYPGPFPNVFVPGIGVLPAGGNVPNSFAYWFGGSTAATFVSGIPLHETKSLHGDAKANDSSTNSTSASINNSSASSQSSSSGGSDASNAHSSGVSDENTLQNSSSNTTSMSNNSSSSAEASDSQSTSVSVQDVYLVKPMVDTIIPIFHQSFSVASANVAFANVNVYDGTDLQTLQVDLTWLPQPDISSQRLYRRNTSPLVSDWEYRQLSSGASSFEDVGDSDWLIGSPPNAIPSLVPSLIKLSLNDIIDTKPIRSKAANSKPQRLGLGPFTLGPAPSSEPNNNNAPWSFDILIKSGGQQTGYAASITGAFLLGHGQSQIRATGTSPSWQLQTNRFGQSGGPSPLDIVGDLKLAPGNNVLTLLGETSDHQPVSLEGTSVALTITPESDWLQSLE